MSLIRREFIRTGALLIGFTLALSTFADDWPQWLGPQRDGVWRESGIIKSFTKGGPPVLWRAVIGGGYAGPAVADGKVFVVDRLLATDAALSDNFSRGVIAGTERIVCIDAASGKPVWTNEYNCPYTMSYPAGPRATPIVAGGRVYTLGAEGNLLCLEAATGKTVWSRDFKKDYNAKTPMWGFSASPLLDGKRLICLVGGSNTTAVAFDKDTGVELWHSLTAKEPGYCPPVIIEAGGRRQLIVWHPQAVSALDPETGAVFWSQQCDIKAGMTIATPRRSGDLLFFTCFYNGSMMFKLDAEKPAATLLWQSKRVSEKNTDALHSTMSTPFIEDGHIYGVCSYGQLRCLDAGTGDRLWETLKATTADDKEMRWGNAFIVKNADRFFLFNEKGDLIIAKLSPKGYEEVSRAHLIEPANNLPGREVVWSHPAFAGRRIYVRNDQVILCADLAEH